MAIINYNLKNYENSLRNINIFLEKFKTTNGNAEMIKGLSLIGLGNEILACEYFKSALGKGKNQAQEFLNSYYGK